MNQTTGLTFYWILLDHVPTSVPTCGELFVDHLFLVPSFRGSILSLTVTQSLASLLPFHIFYINSRAASTTSRGLMPSLGPSTTLQTIGKCGIKPPTCWMKGDLLYLLLHSC